MLFWLLDRLFSRRPPPPFRPPTPRRLVDAAGRPYSWPLDQPIIRLTDTDCLSIRDLCEGVLCLGNPGSGKSSTTGTIIPLAALADGWGIVAYTSKPDDVDSWKKWCAQADRSREFIIIRLDGQSRFNLIEYELRRDPAAGSRTYSVACLLTQILREGLPATLATDTAHFFETQLLILLCYALDLLTLAGERISLDNLAKLIETAPQSREEVGTARWHEGYCCSVLSKADAATEGKENRRLYDKASGFFLVNWASMNERTRGDVLSTFEGSLFQMGREPLRSLLDTDQGWTYVPEMLRDGAVFVIDCPESVYGASGRLATIVLKRVFKEYLRRRVATDDSTRVILNFCDECQTCVTRDDAVQQQVFRSNRIVTVFLTQSIDNLEVALGSEAHCNSLANALTTHIYHATSGRTAEWIQQRIAQNWKKTRSVSYSARGTENRGSPSVNESEHLYPQVLAADLARLRTGGPLNGSHVDCYAFKPGRIFVRSGAPYCRVTFRQQ